MRVNNLARWDALDTNRPDHLLETKRRAEAEIGERVGWEPDWKLQLIMLREKREEEAADSRRAALARDPDYGAKRSAVMRANWQAGKFANRKQAYLKKTPERVERARRLRDQGWGYAEIGAAIGITAYTAMRWLGWIRKEQPTNRYPVTYEGITYPSLREAERQTGVARHRLKKRLTP